MSSLKRLALTIVRGFCERLHHARRPSLVVGEREGPDGEVSIRAVHHRDVRVAGLARHGVAMQAADEEGAAAKQVHLDGRQRCAGGHRCPHAVESLQAARCNDCRLGRDDLLERQGRVSAPVYLYVVPIRAGQLRPLPGLNAKPPAATSTITLPAQAYSGRARPALQAASTSASDYVSCR
jgi:hypothetical protein